MNKLNCQQEYDEIFNDDKLNIKSSVIDFAHLIEQDTYNEGVGSKVYSIAAEFGIGKTFFCDKLNKVLQKDKVRTVKMNIWEMDFYENPLVPILAKLNEVYSKKGKELPSALIDATFDFTKKALGVLGETLIQSASNTILNADITETIKKHFCIDNIYTDFKCYQDAISDLKKALTQWAKKSKTPIIIIIDELDRCKPDYAVKTLEILKHIFDISGFVFVLALDEKQLGNSVKSLFGTTNFEGYKRKFINNTFILPTPKRKEFANFLYDKSEINTLIESIQKDKRELVFRINVYNLYYCAYEFSSYGNVVEEKKAKEFNVKETSSEIIKRYFAAYSEYFGFTLRQMEQVFDRLVLFTKQILASQEMFSPDLAVLLVCLHEFDAEIYTRIYKEFHYIQTVISRIDNISILTMVDKLCSQDKQQVRGFNRTIAPEIPFVRGYSGYFKIVNNSGQEVKQVFDNVDRFFIKDMTNLVPQTIDFNKMNIKTLDFNELRQKYFENMDFISHFE